MVKYGLGQDWSLNCDVTVHKIPNYKQNSVFFRFPDSSVCDLIRLDCWFLNLSTHQDHPKGLKLVADHPFPSLHWVSNSVGRVNLRSMDDNGSSWCQDHRRTTLPDGYQGPLLCWLLQSIRSSTEEVSCILLISVSFISIQHSLAGSGSFRNV